MRRGMTPENSVFLKHDMLKEMENLKPYQMRDITHSMITFTEKCQRYKRKHTHFYHYYSNQMGPYLLNKCCALNNIVGI